MDLQGYSGYRNSVVANRLSFAVGSILVVSNFIHSGPGRATLAIREDEIAAEAMGVNTTKYKVIAFVMGAVMASIAGTLYASYQQSVFPKDYGFMKSIDVLIIVVFWRDR